MFHEQLELMLKFICQGECEVKTEMLEQFLDLGKYLEVKGLLHEVEIGAAAIEEQMRKEKNNIKKEEGFQNMISSTKDIPTYIQDGIQDVHLKNSMSCNFQRCLCHFYNSSCEVTNPPTAMFLQ